MAPRKTAIVTGGASGIGKELSLALANEGVHVLVLDITQAESFDRVSEKHQHTEYKSLDVTNLQAFADVLRSFISQHKRLDYFYSNAGVTEIPLLEGDTKEPNLRTIQVNLIAVLHSVGLVINQMSTQKRDEAGRRGSIICTASICGLWPTPGLAMYSASKAGLIAFVESYGSWLPDKSIYLNAVCPGMIATNFGTQVMYDVRKAYLTSIDKAIQILLELRQPVVSGKAFVVTKKGTGESPKRPPFDSSSESDIAYVAKGMRAVWKSTLPKDKSHL